MGRLFNCTCIGNIIPHEIVVRTGGLTNLFFQKISTIATGVCMFVGKIPWLRRSHGSVDRKCAGAAIGSLGRHTRITPDGMPIFDDRSEVLLKVGPSNLKLLYC